MHVYMSAALPPPRSYSLADLNIAALAQRQHVDQLLHRRHLLLASMLNGALQIGGVPVQGVGRAVGGTSECDGSRLRWGCAHQKQQAGTQACLT